MISPIYPYDELSYFPHTAKSTQWNRKQHIWDW